MAAALILFRRSSSRSPLFISSSSSYIQSAHCSSGGAANPNPKTRTPHEKQFETWLQNLKPGFTPADVELALRAQSDPDLALDIFRWTAQQRRYKHDAQTYLTMLHISVSSRRYRQAETLVEEIIAGACPHPTLALYNSVIKFCCGRKFLFNRAFDVYKKMWRSQDAKPSLQTYTLLLNSLLTKFNRLNVSYGYMHTVRSIHKQMKSLGIIPDTLVLNMIIKAFSKCLQLDEAVRVFREMGLYGCQPNLYTYSYLIKGLCEKGKVNTALEFFREMRRRDRDLVPKGSSYMILICSLAMEQRFDVATDIIYDMFSNSLHPDFLTYKTLLEGLCREGKGDQAFQLLDDFRKRDHMMKENTYKMLLNGLHFLS